MIIFDSSTLILLSKIDLLEIFVSDYKGIILIPEKVKYEVCLKKNYETLSIKKMIKIGKIKELKVNDRKGLKKIRNDFNIDSGEAEALMLALQEGAEIIATDDRNAIRACKLLSLNFITAIAFLIRAFEKGLLETDEAIEKLNKLSLIGRYKKSIIKDSAIRIQGGN